METLFIALLFTTCFIGTLFIVAKLTFLRKDPLDMFFGMQEYLDEDTEEDDFDHTDNIYKIVAEQNTYIATLEERLEKLEKPPTINVEYIKNTPC